MQNEHNHNHDHEHGHDHHHNHDHGHEHSHDHHHSAEAAPAAAAPEMQAAPVAAEATAGAAAAATAPAAENSNRMIMGILAYIGILVIIPFLVAKDDSFVKFHVKQGLVLTGIWLVLWVLGMTMWMLYPFIALANLGLIVLSIIGIVHVVQKKETELPLVGGLAKHINI